ncbi:hypothetical protein PLESTF_000819800 [Pleodorina starrii]|nr:hypothetical protein PLESTF_000819800 [Pleodorina starrii]
MLQHVDLQTSVDHVRGCTSLEDSMRLLSALTNLALAHQQHTRDAAASTTAANNPNNPNNGRALSPGPAQHQASSSTPRQRTPGRAGTSGREQQDVGGGGGGGSGRPPAVLSLSSLEGEMRLLDGLAERLPAVLEAGGGGNWFPGDIMAALQASYLSTLPQTQELAAAVEQRAARLRADLPGLRAGEARLAAEVTVAGEAEWRQHAEATRAELTALLDSSAAFFHTFQTGLGVWCAASRSADTCGLGPLATDLLQRYHTLRRLGEQLARIRQAHSRIVGCEAPLKLLEQRGLGQQLLASQCAVEQLQQRIAAEQRLLAETEATAAAARACLAAGARG